MKAGKLPFRLQPHVLESGWWREESTILGEGPSRSTRRRIRRLRASRLLIRPCGRGGGRVEVRRDLSKVFQYAIRAQCRVSCVFTHEICVVGVCTESEVGIRCITLRHISGELPELPIWRANVRHSRTFAISLTHTFGLPYETYTLREFLGVLRGGRDTGDEAEPELILMKSVKTLVRVAML